MDVDKLCNQNNLNEIVCTENLFHSERNMDSVNTIHKEENILNICTFNDTNNITDTADIKTATSDSQTIDKNFPTFENWVKNTALHENDDKDATHSHLQANLQFLENDERCNLNIASSNGSSTVQKEYLLEMASEVANVLTDNMDHSDSTSFDLDLKSSNHFLSTCLEEQKQLVNDLHIQVSRYVSIV